VYLQITTRCNMRCGHCCFSCAPGAGEDMPHRVFAAALRLAANYGEYICLGGGEPTVHPQFERFLLEAIAMSDSELSPFVATNGKRRMRALMIARLAKAGAITGVLSLDEWHEPISCDVIEAFGNNVRTIVDPFLVGRYLETSGLDRADEPPESMRLRCVCDECFVVPNGTIYQCGCADAPVIGHVDTGIEEPYESVLAMCHRSKEFAEAFEEATV